MDDMNSNPFLFDLSVDENGYSFEYSIESSLAEANKELEELDFKIEETVDSIKALTPECDKLDYALAASSGALCGLVDIFLVGTPGDTPLGNITDKWFADKTIKFAKLCKWDGKIDNKLPIPDELHSAIKYLEECFKVPYDHTSAGPGLNKIYKITPDNHHFKSLAHNPSLCGLFYSILDQFNKTSHFASGGDIFTRDYMGKFELEGATVPERIFKGFVNWIGHIISDNSGSSTSKGRGQGIPSPLWTWINDVTAIRNSLNLKPSELEKNLSDFAAKIYEEGYDARFQTAQAIPVFINELVVRFMYSIRRLFKYFLETPSSVRTFEGLWKSCEPFKNVTVKRMLTVAHGTFCLIDIGDAVGHGFAKGGGSFNAPEFVIRLNLPGLGRFGISIFGEAGRVIQLNGLNLEKSVLESERIILLDHIEGLKILAETYDDKELIKFIKDFENSSAYKEALEKSANLAEKRGVSEDKILRTKSDIDSYFTSEKK